MPEDSGTPAEALVGGEEQPQPTTPSDQPGAGEVAGQPSPGEQPAEEMVSATEAQKRVSGLQRAYDRREHLLQQKLTDQQAEHDESRDKYEAAVTRDMTEEQKKQYGFEKRGAEQDRRDRELQQREGALQERDARMGWKAYYAEMGVPSERFKEAETIEEIQDAAFLFIEGQLKAKQSAPSASGPGPADQVQTGTGASAPGSDFDEYMAEKGLNPFSPEWKKLRKKFLREKKIT